MRANCSLGMQCEQSVNVFESLLISVRLASCPIIRIMGEDIWGRPLLILAVLLIIVGIQFFSIGILYDLLMKTYFESQDKKPYRIRKVFKFDA